MKGLVVLALLISLASLSAAPSPANRLTYLDDFCEPFHPSEQFPRLATPQWVGEDGVEVVVTYGIDDMGTHQNYEIFLRPILERLKQIDGRAPVSIFCNVPRPEEPHLQQWLKEGLSFEVHTLSHPCPILAKGDFVRAEQEFHGCVDLLNHIPNNAPVAFRTPCCDSINSASPRLFAEIFSRPNPAGQFLRMDSSVTMILTTNDPALPREWLIEADGRERFRKYVPFAAFTTTIENYPYPYVQSRSIWEMPFVAPSDWQSQHLHGNANPKLLEDWKVALDLIALKQGTCNFVFHPALWSSPTQHVAFIDYAVAKHKVKFLNYPEVHARLTKNLLAGQPLRAANGQDNGVRLLDLNNDGYLDVVIGNEHLRQTRIWDPQQRRWQTSDFPVALVAVDPTGRRTDSGARFGILSQQQVILLIRNEREAGAWRFEAGGWVSDATLLAGLETYKQPLFTARGGADLGVRLHDVNSDGVCELLVGSASQNALFQWSASQKTWKRLPYDLPLGVSFVNAAGQDNGLRLVDLNGDGADDVVFSNEDRYSIHLMVPETVLGFEPGWSREVIRGQRGQTPEVPMIVRQGAARNNGAWFAQGEMWVQNEDTAHLPNIVEHHSYAELLSGFQPPALSPTQSLAAIQLPTNFVAELVAAEPLVQDPVYLDWSEDGRLWVVEMRDYPQGLDGQGKAGGAVRVLEDTDGDGRYDKSTVFADQLNFPNGLMPWGKGVLISAAPDILYAEDTNGDGKADKVEKLFTGFVEGNQQHRFNGFEYGLDNWLYGANGDSGGTITNLVSRSAQPVSIRGRDFRFQPDTGALEPVAGQTQFGRHRDDWGNWFGNANPIWLWHYWLPEQYLKRNPRLAVERISREVANYPDARRLFPVGRKQQAMNEIGDSRSVTSANSPTPYRDDLFGDEFARAVFISEPVHSLIRCEILEADDVSFRSHRWNVGTPREFLASTDPWFRPTGMKVGPDGALYVADMYRQFIEHPQWIPEDIKRRSNLRAGEDRGRIYRIYPKGATLRPPPRLDRKSTAELVEALDHPNGWQRDTVQRLLVTRHDQTAVEGLERLSREAKNPKVRLQALCTLDGLDAIKPDILILALADPHPAVREHVARLSERVWSLQPSAPLADALLNHISQEPIRFLYQLALSLGEWDDPRAAQALGRIALRDPNTPAIATAVMSSATRRPAEVLLTLLDSQSDLSPLRKLIDHLVLLCAVDANGAQLELILSKLSLRAGVNGRYADWQMSAFAQLSQELEKGQRSLLDIPVVAKAFPALLKNARQLAADDTQPIAGRVAALSLLGRERTNEAEDVAALADLLRPQVPQPLQQAALTRLGQLRGQGVPEALLQHWESLAPAIRAQALEVLLRREPWVRTLLDRLEASSVLVSQVGATARQRLVSYPTKSLRSRAQKLFSQSIDPQRQKLIDRYLPQVRGVAGDAQHGANLFAHHCAICHPLRGQGTGAAPDLASVVDRTPERMLIAILDPNRAVEERYVNYIASTKSGDEISGLLAGESANNITLVSAAGTRETILRRDLESLASTRLSIMPEGFEQFLQPRDIADLLAFVEANARNP